MGQSKKFINEDMSAFDTVLDQASVGVASKKQGCCAGRSATLGIESKIVISLVQVLSSLKMNFSIPFPPIYAQLTKWLSMIELNLFELMPLDCTFPGLVGFHSLLVLRTAVPLGFFAAAAILRKATRNSRLGDRLLVVAAMQFLAALGFLMLAAGQVWFMAIGTTVALALGWGWTGLFTLAVVEFHARNQGVATGIAMTGVYAGAVVGPLLFALIEDRSSFGSAWVFAALMTMGGAAAVLVARSRLMLANRG